MLRRLLRNLRTRWRYRVMCRQYTTAQRRADRWQRDAKLLREILQREAATLKAMLAQSEEAMQALVGYAARATEEAEAAHRLVEESQSVADALRGELTVKDCEIEALVTANRVFLERWREESAIAVMRRAAINLKEGEQVL